MLWSKIIQRLKMEISSKQIKYKYLETVPEYLTWLFSFTSDIILSSVISCWLPLVFLTEIVNNSQFCHILLICDKKNLNWYLSKVSVSPRKWGNFFRNKYKHIFTTDAQQIQNPAIDRVRTLLGNCDDLMRQEFYKRELMTQRKLHQSGFDLMWNFKIYYIHKILHFFWEAQHKWIY